MSQAESNLAPLLRAALPGQVAQAALHRVDRHLGEVEMGEMAAARLLHIREELRPNGVPQAWVADADAPLPPDRGPVERRVVVVYVWCAR